MEYFKYICSNRANPLITLELYQAVQSYKPLAMKLYGSRYEDVMDEVFYHALEHYNPEKGVAKNYIAALMKMGKSDYKKEVFDDVVMEVSSDTKAKEEYSENDEYADVFIDSEDKIDVIACIKALLPMVIKDADWFCDTTNTTSRKINYKSILNSYKIDVFREAIKELVECSDYIKYINDLSKECHYKKADSDRYKKSLEKTLLYRNTINDIIICENKGLRKNKYVFKLDIKFLISSLINMFYSEDGVAYRNICDVPVYCSISGSLLFTLESIKVSLEQDIIGTILAQRTNLKVLHYIKGDYILFTTSREDEPSFILNMFKVGVTVPFRRLSVKKVKGD